MPFDNFETQTIEAWKIERSRQGTRGNVQTKTKEFEFFGYIDYISGQKIQKGVYYQEDTTHVLMTNSLTVNQINLLKTCDNYEIRHGDDVYRVLDVDKLSGDIGSTSIQHQEILLQYVKVDNIK